MGSIHFTLEEAYQGAPGGGPFCLRATRDSLGPRRTFHRTIRLFRQVRGSLTGSLRHWTSAYGKGHLS
jgi:hypothetical protein